MLNGEVGDKTVAVDVPPVIVTAISGTGDGGASLPPSGTVFKTPDSQPNIVLSVITPLVAILVRFLNVYVGMVVGLLGTSMANGNAIPAPDFYHLVLKCMGLALGGAVVLSLKDLVTIFGKLEQRYPLITGSV